MNQDRLHKNNLIALIGVFLIIFYVRYLGYRCKKLIKGLCPRQKMSCIGLRPRNMLTLADSCNLAISWSTVYTLNYMFLVSAIQKYRHNVSPDVAFLLHNMYWFLSLEGHNIFMIYYLSKKEIPFVEKTVPRPQFYQKHMILEPRRARVPNSRQNIFKQLWKEKAMHDKEVLQISQGTRYELYRTRMPVYSTSVGTTSITPIEC